MCRVKQRQDAYRGTASLFSSTTRRVPTDVPPTPAYRRRYLSKWLDPTES